MSEHGWLPGLLASGGLTSTRLDSPIVALVLGLGLKVMCGLLAASAID